MIRLNPDKYGLKILELFDNLGLLTQLAHNNEEIESVAVKNNVDLDQNDLSIKSYLKEARLNDPYMEIKDVFYNLSKSLQKCIDVVMDNKLLKEKLFEVFYSYIDHEY
jgi:hypothetical protein